MRVSSTRRRMRSCSRWFRQLCQRACAFCSKPSFSTAPSGPFGLFAHACVPANEKLVVMKSALRKIANAIRLAPQKLNPGLQAAGEKRAEHSAGGQPANFWKMPKRKQGRKREQEQHVAENSRQLGIDGTA